MAKVREGVAEVTPNQKRLIELAEKAMAAEPMTQAEKDEALLRLAHHSLPQLKLLYGDKTK